MNATEITVVFPEPLETPRLTLRALSSDALDAWVVCDVEALTRTMGARPRSPVTGPPLDPEDLIHLRHGLRGENGGGGWWAWMVLLRRTAEPIGLVTLTGSADPEDGLACGYSFRPGRRGHVYEEEALRAVLAWTLADGIPCVRAAVPAGNAESMRIALGVGMHRAGTASDPVLGEIAVFERTLHRDRPHR